MFNFMKNEQPSYNSYEFLHYSKANLSKIDLNQTYINSKKNLIYHTPNGLWLSLTGEKDWENYCKNKNENLEKLNSKFRILFKPHANILILHDDASFLAFEKEYGFYPEGKEKYENNYTINLSIKWSNIVNDFQGLAVAAVLPKLYDVGLWYDTWCCTSACIWDLQAVEKAEKLT